MPRRSKAGFVARASCPVRRAPDRDPRVTLPRLQSRFGHSPPSLVAVTPDAVAIQDGLDFARETEAPRWTVKRRQVLRDAARGRGARTGWKARCSSTRGSRRRRRSRPAATSASFASSAPHSPGRRSPGNTPACAPGKVKKAEPSAWTVASPSTILTSQAAVADGHRRADERLARRTGIVVPADARRAIIECDHAELLDRAARNPRQTRAVVDILKKARARGLVVVHQVGPHRRPCSRRQGHRLIAGDLGIAGQQLTPAVRRDPIQLEQRRRA